MLIKTHPLPALFSRDTGSSEIAEGIDYEYQTCDNRFKFIRYSPSRLIALQERPDDQNISTVYPDNYEPYRFHELTGLLAYAREFVQKRKVHAIKNLVPNDAKILDMGCGAGSLLLLLQKYGEKTWELYGNDLHKESLSRLTDYNIKTHPCDYHDIDQPGYFDLIILNQVIEHFSDPRDVLQYCRKYLKPTGHLFIETPSTDGPDFHLFKSGCWGGYPIPRHFYPFNEDNLKQLLTEEGYTDARTNYLASPVFWVQSLHHSFYHKGVKKLAGFFQLWNIPLMSIFTICDMIIISLGMNTSNICMVARRGST